jgi:hypothetical protein
VDGSHTYLAGGTFTVTTTLSDDAPGTATASATSAATVSVGPPSKLVVTTEPPSSSVAGSTFTVKVSVEDSRGDLVFTDNSDAIKLGLTKGTGSKGAHLTCTADPVTVSAGVASFSCFVGKVGTGYTLTASDDSLTPAVSNAFDITVGAAKKLGFVTEPPPSTATGQKFTVVLAVEDAFGNIETADNASLVTLAIKHGTGGSLATLSCVMDPLRVEAGIATFGCSIDQIANGYVLQATASGLSKALSTKLNITTGSSGIPGPRS